MLRLKCNLVDSSLILCMLNSIAIDLSVTTHRDCTVGRGLPLLPVPSGGGGDGGGVVL